MEISLSSVWQDLIAFVKNPRLDPLPTHFLEQPQKVFPYLLALDFLLMIPLMGIMSATGIEDTDHEITKLLDDPMKLVLMAVVLAPILEELFFRFPIGNWWKTPVRLWNQEEANWSIVTWCKSNFKTIFWTFTIVFAAVHFTNFAATVPIYLAPILVLPQLVLGIMLGYIRVGWGTRYSILFHAIHNGIPISLMLLGGGMAPN
ncbi:MAG: CPBP family glutamic-type intramembrane protease [Saprospiraceae bacterium]